jgi:molecular chaperone DnaJ
MADYYKILGLSSSASLQDIKKAYRKLALKHHPDQHQSSSDQEKKKAEQAFKEATEAYEVLSDPEKRKLYDQVGHDNFRHNTSSGNGFEGFSASGVDFASIFEEFFSGFHGAQSGTPQAARGRDIWVKVSITLEEAFQGIQKSLEFSTIVRCSECSGLGAEKGTKVTQCATCEGRGEIRTSHSLFMRQTCNRCHGTGQNIASVCKKCRGSGCVRDLKKLTFRIPPGIEHESQLRIAGEGEAGERGGPFGDAIIQVNVQPHSIFKRRGNDIFMQYPMSIAQAALGCSLEVPSIDGKTLCVVFKEGTQFREKKVVPGQGMPGRSGRGNLIVEAEIYVPVKLSDRQKALLQDFCEEENNKTPEATGFFSKLKQFFKSL